MKIKLQSTGESWLLAISVRICCMPCVTCFYSFFFQGQAGADIESCTSKPTSKPFSLMTLIWYFICLKYLVSMKWSSEPEIVLSPSCRKQRHRVHHRHDMAKNLWADMMRSHTLLVKFHPVFFFNASRFMPEWPFKTAGITLTRHCLGNQSLPLLKSLPKLLSCFHRKISPCIIIGTDFFFLLILFHRITYKGKLELIVFTWWIHPYIHTDPTATSTKGGRRREQT